MKTSNFSKSANIPNAISIALRDPQFYNGERYPALAPPPDLLGRYKRKEINDDRYTMEYYSRVLYNLDPRKVYEDLKDKVLLCWCGKSKFCHRRLVAEWIKKELNIDVEEI